MGQIAEFFSFSWIIQAVVRFAPSHFREGNLTSCVSAAWRTHLYTSACSHQMILTQYPVSHWGKKHISVKKNYAKVAVGFRRCNWKCVVMINLNRSNGWNYHRRKCMLYFAISISYVYFIFVLQNWHHFKISSIYQISNVFFFHFEKKLKNFY